MRGLSQIITAITGLASGLSALATGHTVPGELPKRVEEYISRVSECIHWSKQVDSGTGDPVKAAEISRAIQALHCKDLQTEAFFLHREYKTDAAAVKAVESATQDWMKTIGRPPEDDPAGGPQGSIRN